MEVFIYHKLVIREMKMTVSIKIKSNKIIRQVTQAPQPRSIIKGLKS